MCSRRLTRSGWGDDQRLEKSWPLSGTLDDLAAKGLEKSCLLWALDDSAAGIGLTVFTDERLEKSGSCHGALDDSAAERLEKSHAAFVVDDSAALYPPFEQLPRG
ncbi:hypothetical protein MVEN_01640400 [Mycena venus]|uniref:Uncharacterized protein n=1 Tax=Mycena venus TaxID=2733690 RepID=A0A8H6XN46_9AGAR|nr:hypothetical protein MVEN_01640400 [Mycena venus]